MNANCATSYKVPLSSVSVINLKFGLAEEFCSFTSTPQSWSLSLAT